jgi:hypothetical protein
MQKQTESRENGDNGIKAKIGRKIDEKEREEEKAHLKKYSLWTKTKRVLWKCAVTAAVLIPVYSGFKIGITEGIKDYNIFFGQPKSTAQVIRHPGSTPIKKSKPHSNTQHSQKPHNTPTNDSTTKGTISTSNTNNANSTIHQNDVLHIVEYIGKDCKRREGTVEFTKQSGNIEGNVAVANGLTNKGTWYQAGVKDYGNQIVMVWDLFDSKGSVIKNGNVPFNMQVDRTHKFYFELSIGEGKVSMYAQDLNNKAESKAHFSAEGEYFIGSKKCNENGYSTSLFRELHIGEDFNTKELSPQKITLMYPKIETTTVMIVRTSKTEEPMWWLKTKGIKEQTRYTTGPIDIGLDPKQFIIFIPRHNKEKAFDSIQVTVSKEGFVTQGHQ